MNNEWRYSAKRVSKFNPALRDQNGIYLANDWIGFFQIGKKFNNTPLTFESYCAIEDLYIEAAVQFFKFHNCNRILIRNLELYEIADYLHGDKDELLNVYSELKDNYEFEVARIKPIVKLILRELVWGEILCASSEEVALRFGHDFYMYLNFPSQMDELIKSIQNLGLFVD